MDISLIPADVIMAIFECIALSPWLPPREEEFMELEHALPPFPWNDNSTIIAGSHVCKRWRESALATRACWSTIVVNFDICTKEEIIMGQIHKLEMHFMRARNRPMTLILINDSPRTAPNVFPRPFTHALYRCLLGASRLHVRVLRGDIASPIITMLSEVPKLEHLAFWHTRWDEIRGITRIQESCHWLEGRLPGTYLRHAPLLRTVHTRGLPHPDPNSEPSPLPRIETLVIDDYLSSVAVPADTTLPQTFANVTSLTLLSDGGEGRATAEGPVVFPALEHLEIGFDAVHAFFVLSKRIAAPRIRDLGIHVNNMRWEDSSQGMPEMATLLHSSVAPFKSLTIHKFAYQLARSSHSRCLQVTSAFWFVDSLEYRRCVLRFPSTWDNVWRPGNDDDWDKLVSMETYSGISPIGEYDEDLEEEELLLMEQVASTVVPSGAGSDTELVGSLSQGVVEQPDEGISSNDSSTPSSPTSVSEICFMPHLQILKFCDGSFLDEEGAIRFAEALGIRQKHLKWSTDGSRILEKIKLLNVVGVGSGPFVDRVRSSKFMEGVEVSCD